MTATKWICPQGPNVDDGDAGKDGGTAVRVAMRAVVRMAMRMAVRMAATQNSTKLGGAEGQTCHLHRAERRGEIH